MKTPMLSFGGIFVRRFRKFIMFTLAVFAIVVVLGFTYEAVMSARDALDFPAPGQMVEVDGYRLHINCIGNGSPTVILDAGAGGWSADWSLVQPLAANTTRVCAYDRPGFGWSDASPQPRDAHQAVSELHTLLVNSGEAAPYLLIGHSNGAVRMLLYSHTYPQEIAGVILVDPTPLATSEKQLSYLSADEQAEYSLLAGNSEESNSESLSLFSWLETLCPFGITRILSSSLLDSTPYEHLPAAAQSPYRAAINRCSYFGTFYRESIELPYILEQARLIRTLEDIPVTVLASTSLKLFHSDPNIHGFSSRLLDLLDRMLRDSQREIATLSSIGVFIEVNESGHYLMLDRPDAVIQAINTLTKAFRES